MLNVSVEGNAITVGKHCTIRLERTLRLPDDGKTYPLPPSLGAFPIVPVADHADRVPERWRKEGGFIVPIYQREALWLNFLGHDWHPVAIKVGVGRINALTGARWDERLHAKPQDYLVCPTQPWLDGIKTDDGTIRQFVATPLGAGRTIEGQVSGQEQFGGLQLLVFEAKRGKFPEENPTPPGLARRGMVAPGAVPFQPLAASGNIEMGIGAGGKMTQAIYPDPHGVATWDERNTGEVIIHLVNSEQYRAITGIAPPPTPVDAAEYTSHGYPWYEFYDEGRGDIAASETLQKVRPVQELEREAGTAQDDAGFEVLRDQIRQIGRDPKKTPPVDR